MKPIALLLTARDPGTAHAFSVLLKAARQRPEFEVRVLAQSPGLEILRRNPNFAAVEMHAAGRIES